MQPADAARQGVVDVGRQVGDARVGRRIGAVGVGEMHRDGLVALDAVVGDHLDVERGVRGQHAVDRRVGLREKIGQRVGVLHLAEADVLDRGIREVHRDQVRQRAADREEESLVARVLVNRGAVSGGGGVEDAELVVALVAEAQRRIRSRGERELHLVRAGDGDRNQVVEVRQRERGLDVGLEAGGAAAAAGGHQHGLGDADVADAQEETRVVRQGPRSAPRCRR